MKILLIVTLYLISGPVSCFDVIGYSGGSVLIYCRGKQYGGNPKYFCKTPSAQCVYFSQMPNTWSHTDRLSLRDSSGDLRVIYRNLSLQDAGSYQFGEAGVWNQDVNLKVNENLCCSSPNTVSGYLGETVTISCSYPEEYERNTKFLFKQDGRDFTPVMDTTVTQRGRFSISEDRSSAVLRMTISDVREDDGGVYYCGVGFGGISVGYYSFYKETQLQVTVTDTDCSPGMQLEDIKEVDGDYENDHPVNLNHMSPVYQNLNSNTNQSDPVYQSLDPKTKEPNSVYCSLKPNTD
ncbi:hypothetical protein SRHO_G00177640 [Serrasalmus rhombeus]